MPPDAIAKVISVRVGRPRTLVEPGNDGKKPRTWRTSFFRDSVEGPIHVGLRGLAGDEVADKRYHGSPDQAVLFYSAAHYPLWREELHLAEMGPGGFGENLTVDGATEADVCLGDRLRVGSALFEVTSPRFPCWKIDRRWETAGITSRVAENGRCGWYVRVLETGSLQNGGDLIVESRDWPNATIAKAARAAFGPAPFEEEARVILDCEAPMDAGLKPAIQARLARATSGT